MSADKIKQLLIDYNVTFNSESGTRVAEDLKAFCGYNDSCYFPEQPNVTAFHLGQRNVYLRILNFLERFDKERQETTINE